ncbi:MAG: type II toxin-antitoxin system RelE/ParE family toxin [Candidatus Staskawiczbacteria bacterium]|nr:type II toxin-antitoxin system RelE/ParE family toxin [Candidatus Staskawiczbacteria bacterium]
MIYLNIDYKVKFYFNPESGRSDVRKYIYELDKKERNKVLKYVEFLRLNNGVLDEPYSKHIKDKIRELRVDFSNKKHRIFYFTFVNKNIILLHAFLKKTAKTPLGEIKRAEENYNNVINNPKLYE